LSNSKLVLDKNLLLKVLLLFGISRELERLELLELLDFFKKFSILLVLDFFSELIVYFKEFPKNSEYDLFKLY
jgi:hypothetical protein